MLAVVKTRRTENRVRITGREASAILATLRRHYRVEVIENSRRDDDELIDANASVYSRANQWRLLAGYRLKAGLTQRELARRIGVTQSVVSEYERNRRPLTERAALKFAAALGIDPAKLSTCIQPRSEAVPLS